tara:strand:- start:41 stop:931 length:891 start_codon:yes stop_codon:yes gene_type:complete
MNKLIKTTLAILLLGLMLFSTISFAIISSVSALTIDSVTIKDEIQPGKTTRITMGLENDADEDIEDVSVTLDLTDVPFAPFDSASEYSIEEIEEDDTEYAEFEIIALNNAQAGIYKIPVKITYIQDGDDKTKNSLISVVVDSKPEIDASIEDGLLLKGQDNEFFIKITNKGLSDAKFVEIEIGQGQYNLLVGNKQYIGDIDSDDFDSVKVNAFFNRNVGNSVNLPVTVIYKDDLNKEYRETFNLNLQVYTEDRAVELGLMEKSFNSGYVVGIVFIIVLYLVYRRLRKKARDKRNGK